MGRSGTQLLQRSYKRAMMQWMRTTRLKSAENILKKLSLVQDVPLHQTTLQNTTNSGRSLILCTRTKLAVTACISIGQTDQPYKHRQEQEPLMMMMTCTPELQSQ